jgi:hypothetical protein
MGFSESFAPFFSRVLIGIELALGILVLQKNFLRSIIIPATILLLFVFTTHLTIETIQNGGNSGNCGCFGSLLPMTPIEAILKNVAAMALLVWLFLIMPKSNEKNDNFWILTTVTFASILALFMMAPIQPIESSFTVSEPETTAVDTLAVDTTKVATEKTVISKDTLKKIDNVMVKIKGRKTLCFFVPGCDHCRDAAKELTELRKTTKNFPEISIIFMNEEADLIPAFFKYTGAEYPYKIIEVIPFWKVLGSGKDTPGVKYLWNGNEYKYYWGITDNKFIVTDFEKLINKPYTELKK